MRAAADKAVMDSKYWIGVIAVALLLLAGRMGRINRAMNGIADDIDPRVELDLGRVEKFISEMPFYEGTPKVSTQTHYDATGALNIEATELAFDSTAHAEGTWELDGNVLRCKVETSSDESVIRTGTYQLEIHGFGLRNVYDYEERREIARYLMEFVRSGEGGVVGMKSEAGAIQGN